MNTCKECGELNGNNRATCYKCNAPLDPPERTDAAAAYANEEEDKATIPECCISILIPIVGFILSHKYKKAGLKKRATTLSAVASIAGTLYVLLFS